MMKKLKKYVKSSKNKEKYQIVLKTIDEIKPTIQLKKIEKKKEIENK